MRAARSKTDKLTKLDTHIQVLENKFKNMVAKNPDLK
jgi:transposase